MAGLGPRLSFREENLPRSHVRATRNMMLQHLRDAACDIHWWLARSTAAYVPLHVYFDEGTTAYEMRLVWVAI